ncbi:cytochrome c [Methyloterricola oryzae]|uniref:cytochrome c n=1 Tax=Methyloterricola oryzae TaxID=1495050 RepID=UPI0005EBCDEB|nr:cytochrome c [Methyloterricola oryzae]
MTPLGPALAVSCLTICLASCSTVVPGAPARLPDTGEPALHAVHEQELRAVMAQMNSLMFDTLRTELEIDKERRQRARQIADAARELSKAVDGIPATLPRLGLSEAEQVSFRALAHRLDDQAQGLEQLSRSNQIDSIEPALQQMTLTCNACHQLFRKLDHHGKKP